MTEELVAVLESLNTDAFKDFADQEMAGYLAALCQSGLVPGFSHLTHTATIELCRNAVATWKQK